MPGNALDGQAFLAYAEQVLASTLCAGEVVVMGNVRTHNVAAGRDAIEARGASAPHVRTRWFQATSLRAMTVLAYPVDTHTN